MQYTRVCAWCAVGFMCSGCAYAQGVHVSSGCMCVVCACEQRCPHRMCIGGMLPPAPTAIAYHGQPHHSSQAAKEHCQEAEYVKVLQVADAKLLEVTHTCGGHIEEVMMRVVGAVACPAVGRGWEGGIDRCAKQCMCYE